MPLEGRDYVNTFSMFWCYMAPPPWATNHLMGAHLSHLRDLQAPIRICVHIQLAFGCCSTCADFLS